MARYDQRKSADDQHRALAVSASTSLHDFATTAFAVAQATSAYGMSWIFAQSHAYQPLYLIGAVAFVAALALSLATAPRRRQSSPPPRTRTP